MNKPSIRQLVMLGIGLALLGWVLTWGVDNFELVDEEYQVGYSAKARRNPFLAAEFFLREMGTDVESISGRFRLYDLPPATDALIVNDFGANLNQTRYENLMSWVTSGGHLVLTPGKIFNQQSQSSGNRILDELGIRLHFASIHASSNADAIKNYFEPSTVTTINFSEDESAQVAFDKRYYLQDTRDLATISIVGRHGIHLIQIKQGDGLITILSDNYLLRNPRQSAFFKKDHVSIGDYDHAYFLWLLVNDAKKVWLLYRSDFPPIYELMWRLAPYVCVSLMGLLLAWLWWITDRFGPRLRGGSSARRNLLEQLLMSANYEWIQDRSVRRVQLNRELFLHDLRLKDPILAQKSPAEQCEYLAKKTAMDPRHIEIALFADWQGERDFIQLSYYFQQLKQTL